VVSEWPKKCKWGVPIEDQPRLDLLLEGVERLYGKGLIAAGVSTAFHMRRALLLAQCPLFMY
jgi:hypothetical protein